MRATERVAEIETQLCNCDRQLRDALQELRRLPELAGAELHFAQQQQRALGALRDDIECALQSAREQQMAAANAFRTAWRRREALESLRKHEHELYRFNEERREQRRKDDLFLQRKHTR